MSQNVVTPLDADLKSLSQMIEDELVTGSASRSNGRKDFRSISMAEGGDIETLMRRVRPGFIVLDATLADVSLISWLRRRPGTCSMATMLSGRSGTDARGVWVVSTKEGNGLIKRWSAAITLLYGLLHRGDTVEAIKRIGDIELDRDRRKVVRGTREIRMSNTEWRLLEYFMERPHRVVARAEIMVAIWGPAADIDGRTIDAHICRLRRALVRGKEYNPIRTVRGAGYSFEPK